MNNINKICSCFLLSGLLFGCATQEDYSEVYKKKCQTFENKIEQDKYCDIDFVGDSITEKYDIKKYYPEFKVVNRGISGDTTDMLLTRMEVSALLLEPKIISLLIGTNNLDTCMDNYEYILKGFYDNLPTTKVVVVSILPRRGKELCQKIKENNEVIHSLADKYQYTYIDLYSPFIKDGDYKVNESLFKDGLHPNKKGYELMTSVLGPVFTNYLNAYNN